MAPKQRLGKTAQTTNVFRNSKAMGTLSNQKQKLNKRLANIDLEEQEILKNLQAAQSLSPSLPPIQQ